MWLEIRAPLGLLLAFWMVCAVICAVVAYQTLRFPPTNQQLLKIKQAPAQLLKALNLELLTFVGKIPNSSATVSIIQPDREIYCATYKQGISSLTSALYRLPESVFWPYSDYTGFPESRAVLPPDNTFAWTIREGFGVMYKGYLSETKNWLCLERYIDFPLELPDPVFVQWKGKMIGFLAPCFVLGLIAFLGGVGWQTRFSLLRGVCIALNSAIIVALLSVAFFYYAATSHP